MARLTLVAQDPGARAATGVHRYAASLVTALRERGVPFDLRLLSSQEMRLGPISLGYYSRVAWQRAITKPPAPVHSLHPIVIPPGTVVMTLHDLMAFRLPPSSHPTAWRWIIRGLARDLRRRPSVYVVPTEIVREDLHKMLAVPRDRIRVAHPGVDTRLFRRTGGLRPDAFLPEGKVDILHVGTAYERKGIHLLVEALGQLGGSRFRLIHVGPTPDRAYVERYQRRAAALGVTVVECGYVPDAQLPAYYANADLFVFPSRDEGAGLPLLEAMACGTNAVVSDLPAHHELAGADACYAELDPTAMAAAIVGALEHPKTAEQLRAHAERFDWGQTAELYVRLYNELGILPPGTV